MKVGTDSMLLGALINGTDKKCALDIGAGTGVLSLMIAQKNKTIRIDAVEIDEPSTKECEINFAASAWSDRLEIDNADFLEYNVRQKYDLVFSNPPFYRSTLVANDRRKTKAKHAQSLPIQPFLEKVSAVLTPKGRFWIIIPYLDRSSWEEIAVQNGLFVKRQIQIFGKKNHTPNRIVLELQKGEQFSLLCDSLVIRNENGTYTKEYIELTKDYHGIQIQ